MRTDWVQFALGVLVVLVALVGVGVGVVTAVAGDLRGWVIAALCLLAIGLGRNAIVTGRRR